MIELYSAQQAKQLDITSQQEYSIPEEVLMEDASFASYNLIKEDIQK
ncbi:MAG: hypothetical protein HUK23_06780, partial [Sphaerochaetaceae bacterium]|nr:hypothetical protein [Sphaerochaetaceae bacterium]